MRRSSGFDSDRRLPGHRPFPTLEGAFLLTGLLTGRPDRIIVRLALYGSEEVLAATTTAPADGAPCGRRTRLRRSVRSRRNHQPRPSHLTARIEMQAQAEVGPQAEAQATLSLSCYAAA